MSYAIVRNEKLTRAEINGKGTHNDRKAKNHTNKDIDPTRTHLNYYIKKNELTYTKEFDKYMKENNLQGHLRSNSIIMCQMIFTSDQAFFDRIGEEETKRYFQTAYNFVANYKNLGEKYILSAKVHMDETTPHLHLVFVPVVHKFDNKSGKTVDKIACSEYWKGKDSYRQLQDNFYKYISDNGFDLERGKSKGTKHIDTETLKQITNFDNIKYELEQEKIEPINTKNTSLLLAQNKELIKYTNNLKLQLSKSYTAIQRVEKLENENTNLKYENQELIKENYKLKDYIDKTFEYVSILFDFSKSTLKNLVNNFVKHFER